MARATRVFVNAKSIKDCRRIAKKRYPDYVITKVKLDTKKPPRRVMRMGLTKRCRVWIKKR